MTTNKLLQIDSTGKQVAGVGVPSGTDINGAGRIISIGGVPANLSGGVTNQVVGYDGSSPPGLVPKTIVFPAGAGWSVIADIDLADPANWPSPNPPVDGACTVAGLPALKHGSAHHVGYPATFLTTYGLTFSWPMYSGDGLESCSFFDWDFESLRLNLYDLLGANITPDIGVRVWVYVSQFPLPSFFDYGASYAVIGLDTGPDKAGVPINQEWNMVILRDHKYRNQRQTLNQTNINQLDHGYGDNLDYDATQNVQMIEIPRIMDWESHVYTGQLNGTAWPDYSALTLVQTLAPPAGLYTFGNPGGGSRLMPSNSNKNIWTVVLGACSQGTNFDMTVSYAKLKVELRK